VGWGDSLFAVPSNQGDDGTARRDECAGVRAPLNIYG